jgi:hypothetical protein
MALAGKFLANKALTTPLFPCEFITLPQIVYFYYKNFTLNPFLALCKYTTLFPLYQLVAFLSFTPSILNKA